MFLQCPPPAVPGAAGRQDVKHAVRDVDFRRGRAGEGRVVVDLADTTTGIDIRLQGQNIIVDFLKTSLPENLRRRLDVVDFGTPVSTVSTFQQGENVRMVIEPRGQWEHNAYQSDTQFVLEVKPLVAGIYPLEQFSDAFDRARLGSKVILTPQPGESTSVVGPAAAKRSKH